eukprot:gene11150-18764_t
MDASSSLMPLNAASRYADTKPKRHSSPFDRISAYMDASSSPMSPNAASSSRYADTEANRYSPPLNKIFAQMNASSSPIPLNAASM